MNTFLAKELNVDVAVVSAALEKWNSEQPLVFSSKASAAFYVAKGTPTIKVITGNNGKVTMDDIRRAIGEPLKTSAPSEFVSPNARDLAATEGFSSEDFTEDARTGKETRSPLASGLKHRITIQDVRRAMLSKGDMSIAGTFYSSAGVAKKAADAGLSPTDFNCKGSKITAAQVKEMIEASVPVVAEHTDDAVSDTVDPFDPFQ
jgi:hypothetical protein